MDAVRAAGLDRNLVRLAVLAVAFGGSLLGGLVALGETLSNGMIWSDFTVFWSAAHAPTAIIYDFARFTDFQADLLPEGAGLRPFPYPPTSLLSVHLLAPLDYGPALLLWLSASLLAFMTATGRAFGWKTAALSALAFPVLVSLIAGQVSLFLAALVIAGVSALDRNPFRAGLLLGIAAALKPQFLVLAPVALLAGAHWRAIAGAGLAAGLFALGATLAFGLAVWTAWFAALGEFLGIGADPRLWRMSMSPFIFAQQLGFGPAAGWSLLALTSFAAIVCVALVYRAPASTADRVMALFGGALLCSPYSMNYDLAALAPAALLLLLDREAGIGTRLAALLAFTGLGGALAPGAAVGRLLWLQWRQTP